MPGQSLAPTEPLGAGGSSPVVPELNKKPMGKIRDSSDSSTQNGRCLTGVSLFHWQNSGKKRSRVNSIVCGGRNSVSEINSAPHLKRFANSFSSEILPSWEVLEKKNGRHSIPQFLWSYSITNIGRDSPCLNQQKLNR